MTRPTWLGAVVLALCCAVTSAAVAQEDIEQRREDAKKFADSAYELLEKGQYAEAIAAFDKADERFHSPVFILFIAEALEKQGKLVEARAKLEQVTTEKLAEYAPDSFRQAQMDGRERAAKLDGRIPTLRVSVTGAGAEGAIVEIDGRALSANELGAPVRVNPGAHRVTATGANGEHTDKTVEAGEGARESVDLVLDAGTGGGDAGGRTSEPSGDEPAPEPGGRNWVGPGIAFGVGGAGLIMGIAAGAVFIGKASDLKDSCESDGDGDPKNCSAEPADAGDDVKLVGNVATAGFVIAGVGIAAGVILALVPMGGDDASATLRPQLHIGPTGAALSGRF